MVEYKVNLKFNEKGKSLNEIITDILKIKLEKYINENYYFLDKMAPLKFNYCSKNDNGIN